MNINYTLTSLSRRYPRLIQETIRTFLVPPSQHHQGPDQILPADNFRAWLPHAAVKLRMKDSGPQSAPPISVPTLFRTQVENLPNNIALQTRDPTGEKLSWTWTYFSNIKGHREISQCPLFSAPNRRRSLCCLAR